MIFLYAFLVGGIICLIGQLILDIFKLTPGHITVLFVILGTFLDFFSFYDKLINIAGAGAFLPITSFGHSLVHGAFNGALKEGFLGLSNNIFNLTSSGIVWTLVLSIIIGIIFKPKS